MELRSVTFILAWTHSPGGSLKDRSLAYINGRAMGYLSIPGRFQSSLLTLVIAFHSSKTALKYNFTLIDAWLQSLHNLRFHTNRHVGLIGSLNTISISIWIVIRQHCHLWFLPHITILFSCLLHSVLKLVQCWCVFRDNLAILVWCLLPPFILVRYQVQKFWQRFHALDSGFGIGLTTLHCLLLDSSLAHPLFQPYKLLMHTPVLRMLCTPAISSSFSRTSSSLLLSLDSRHKAILGRWFHSSWLVLTVVGQCCVGR